MHGNFGNINQRGYKRIYIRLGYAPGTVACRVVWVWVVERCMPGAGAGLDVVDGSLDVVLLAVLEVLVL